MFDVGKLVVVVVVRGWLMGLVGSLFHMVIIVV